MKQLTLEQDVERRRHVQAAAYSALRLHFTGPGAGRRRARFALSTALAWAAWTGAFLCLSSWAAIAAVAAGPDHEVALGQLRAWMVATPIGQLAESVHAAFVATLTSCLQLGFLLAIGQRLLAVVRPAMEVAKRSADCETYLDELFSAFRRQTAEVLFEARKVGFRMMIPDTVQGQMLVKYGHDAERTLELLVGRGELFEWVSEFEVGAAAAAAQGDALVRALQGRAALALFQARKAGVRVHVPGVVRGQMFSRHGDAARRILDLIDGRSTLDQRGAP